MTQPKEDKEVYIVAGLRTIVARFGGSLAKLSSVDLGKACLKALISKAKLDTDLIDEVILGQVISAGAGMNPARQIAMAANLSINIPAITINQVCGSGLRSLIDAARLIKLREAKMVICGGQESMSNAPHFIKLRKEKKFGDATLTDSIISDGLFCNISDMIMGATAELIAEKYNISREELDNYAFNSHKKALEAQASGLFDSELIAPDYYQLDDKNFSNKDEQPRADITIEKLAKLRPVFDKNGKISAGNSSSLNDAGAAIVLMNHAMLKHHNIEPLAKIIGYKYIGNEPKFMGLAPAISIKKLLEELKININDIDLFEINEAFASQIIANIKELNIDNTIVNQQGGAIALGHPLGASGARLILSLALQLKAKKKRYGIASLCIGGGMGIAMLIESC